jgi:hypothetical protein
MANRRARQQENGGQGLESNNARRHVYSENTPDSCQTGFEKVAAWVDLSLDTYKPELSQVHPQNHKASRIVSAPRAHMSHAIHIP